MSLPAAQQKALEIVARGLPEGMPVYLVGGFVRDALLGRESADIDLGLPGEPADAIKVARQVANLARAELPGYKASPFTLDAAWGVARVVFTPAPENTSEKGFYLDIVVLNGGNIETDLSRRDFTINALALPLTRFLAADNTLQLEDTLEVSSGRADLTGRIIRPVSEQNLIDDPLRMLRGVRLRAQLSRQRTEWEFASGTLALFKKHHQLIKQSAAERIREELNKTWLAGEIEKSLRALDESGLLGQIIPEVAQEHGASTSPNPFEQTVSHLNWLEWLVSPTELKQMNWATRPEQAIGLWPEMLARLVANGRERLAVLLWAALLCNIEKATPADETSRAQRAGEIMLRLRFSRDATDRVILIVQHQAGIAELGQNFDPATGEGVSKLEAYRFLRDTQPVQIEMLLLYLAQQGATIPPGDGQRWQQALALVDFLARKYMGSEAERLYGKPRLIEGKQLMKALKLKPGPQVGQLLREIEEAQATGQINTTEEAIELARQNLGRSNE